MNNGARKAVGNTDLFNEELNEELNEGLTHQPKIKKPEKKYGSKTVNITLNSVPLLLREKIRDIYCEERKTSTKFTMSKFYLDALWEKVAKMAKERRSPYPPRNEDPQPGRIPSF